MKVYEIISRNEPVNENLKSSILGGIKKFIGKNKKSVGLGSSAAKIASPLQNISQQLTSGITILKNLGVYGLFGYEINKYVDEIQQGIEHVEAGDWNDATFQTYRKQRSAIFISTLSTMILSSMGSKMVGSAANMLTFGLLSKWFPFLTKLSTTALQLYFMNYVVNTKEGADYIARFLASPVIGDVFGNGSVAAVDWISKKMDQTLGMSIPGAATKDTPDNPQVQQVPFQSKLKSGSINNIVDW